MSITLGTGLGLPAYRNGGVAGFTPASVTSATLKAWYAPNGGYYTTSGGSTPATATGDTVKDWRDSSGNGNSAVTAGNGFTLITNAVNGLPVLRTSGDIANSLRAAFTLAQPCTVYAMMRMKNSPGYSAIVLDGNTINTAAVYADANAASTATTRLYAGGFAATSNFQIGLFDLQVSVLNGASSSNQWAAQSAVTGNPGSASPGGITIGNAAGSTFNPGCDFGEVVVFAGTLSAGDDASMRTYLRNKWAATTADYGRSIAWFGDSLTVGYPLKGFSGPPTKVQASNPTWNVMGQGFTGRLATQGITAYPSEIAPLYRATNSANILVIDLGLNDMLTGGASAATAFASVQNIASLAVATGWDVRIATLASCGFDGTSEAKRDAFNALVYANYLAAKIVDVAANANLGVDGACNNATYFQADKVHLTDAGYTIKAGIGSTALAS